MICSYSCLGGCIQKVTWSYNSLVQWAKPIHSLAGCLAGKGIWRPHPQGRQRGRVQLTRSMVQWPKKFNINLIHTQLKYNQPNHSHLLILKHTCSRVRLTTVSWDIAWHFRSSEFKTHRESTVEGGEGRESTTGGARRGVLLVPVKTTIRDRLINIGVPPALWWQVYLILYLDFRVEKG